VDRVMSREAFFHQARQRADNGPVIRRELVFDAGMNGGMQRGIGQLDSGASMMILDEHGSFLFIKLEPLAWVRGLRRIVSVHGVSSRDG